MPVTSSNKSREIRLGLVMYGGVSLAIYINGVAREFFRVVRGSGAYKWLKGLTDSDIVVDIISGSSAGGINGILLGYALCNNKDFADAAGLWRRDGDIRSLLRAPNGDEPAQSLLDSEGYYQPRLEEAFRFMPDYVARDHDEARFNSSVPELDLFVTGTDVDGNISTIFDDAGHPIDVKDHRSVFQLKHRVGRKQPFDPDFSPTGERVDPGVTLRALAKLARITSCFPAAFAPVSVSCPRSDEDKRKAPEDAKLQEWGRLSKAATFLDGGVIDNKPFTYTLQEIFGRAAIRQVERKLFYVEPDPERFQQPEQASQPNFIQTILASLTSIPGYESISEDLKLLASRNRKLDQYRRLVGIVEKGISASGPPAPLREMHRRSRLILISERVARGVLREQGRDIHLSDPEQRRIGAALFAQFDEFQKDQAEVETILRDFDVYYRLRRLYHMVYTLHDLLYPKEAKNAQEPQLKLDRNDRAQLQNFWQAINWQIETLEIIRSCLERLLDDANFAWQEKSKRLEQECEATGQKDAIERAAQEVWAAVNKAARRLLDTSGQQGIRLEELYGVASKIDQPANCAEAAPANPANTAPDRTIALAQAFKDFHWTLKNTCQVIVREIQQEHVAPEKTLLALTDAYESEILARFLQPCESDGFTQAAEKIRKAYLDFDTLDALRLPLELIGDLHEKDTIETIRISPADADKGFSNKGLSDKVAGDALYHFASFFKRSWRSNDILWGRLDGLCQIVESLLTEKLLADPNQARQHFFVNGNPGNGWIETMKPEYLFPNAGRRTQEDLRQWVENWLGNDAAEGRASKIDKSLFSDFIKLFIEAAQLEILHEEVPVVVSDALEDQTRWNQYRISRAELNRKAAQQKCPPDPERDDLFSFAPPGGKVDNFVGAVAAAARSFANTKGLKDNGDAPRPRFTKLGKFFRGQYRVGAEELLRDLPLLVLLEILAVTLLALRNCVLTVFGPKAEKVKQSWLYFFGVDLPLRVFYGTVVFLRRAPRRMVAIQVSLSAMALLALLVGITWRDPIIYTRDNGQWQFHWLWFLLFVVAPLVILATFILFTLRGWINRRHWAMVTRDVVLGALTIASALALAITIVCLLAHLGGGQLAGSAQAALAGLLNLPRAALTEFLHLEERLWIVYTMLLLASVGLVIAFFLLRRAYRWFGRGRSLDRERLRAALLDHFRVEDLRRLAKLAFNVKPEEFERWSGARASWNKVSYELSKSYLEKWQVERLRDKLLPSQEEAPRWRALGQSVGWADLQYAINALGLVLLDSVNSLAQVDGSVRMTKKVLRAKLKPTEMAEWQIEIVFDQLPEEDISWEQVQSEIEGLGPKLLDQDDWETLTERIGFREQAVNQFFAELERRAGLAADTKPGGVSWWQKLAKMAQRPVAQIKRRRRRRQICLYKLQQGMHCINPEALR